MTAIGLGATAEIPSPYVPLPPSSLGSNIFHSSSTDGEFEDFVSGVTIPLVMDEVVLFPMRRWKGLGSVSCASSHNSRAACIVGAPTYRYRYDHVVR